MKISFHHLVDKKEALDSLPKKQQEEHMKETATGTKEENVIYHLVVAVSLPPSLFEIDYDERPHTHNDADDLKK